MLAPLTHQTLPDACAARLRRMILSGEFAPGDRLPPERELAERFAGRAGAVGPEHVHQLELGIGEEAVLHAPSSTKVFVVDQRKS